MFIHKLGISAVNINELDLDNTISIYPNPITDRLFIKSEGNIIVKVLNSLGQEVYSGTDKQINMNGLNQGIYFIQITNEKGHLLNKKIIKQKRPFNINKKKIVHFRPRISV